jgi:hypothetical protein
MRAHAVRILAACCLATTACSSAVQLSADGIRVRVTAVELQRRLDQVAGFPVRQRLAPLGSIQVESARLMLLPQENSIGLSMPLKVATLGRSWSGTVAFSVAPGYDRQTGTIYLHQFALREVQGTGLPGEVAHLAAGIVTEILRQSVKRIDVYTLDPARSNEGIARLLLKDIEVHQDAVAFHLGL